MPLAVEKQPGSFGTLKNLQEMENLAYEGQNIKMPVLTV